MESQTIVNQQSPIIHHHQPIINQIISTYRARSQLELKEAELVIMQSFSQPGFIDKLIELLLRRSEEWNINTNELDFKRAIANLIKKFSYTFAETSEDKSKFIEMLYNLIMGNAVNFKIKEILGQALEHQFNKDQQFIYKNIVKEKALQLLKDQNNNVSKIDSITFILYAYLNSLTHEDDEINFMIEIIQPFSLLGIQIYRLITQTPFEEWLIKGKLIQMQLQKYFDFYETALQRITECQDEYPEELKQFRENPFLINLLENYLLLFHNNHSIVSLSYPSINTLKNVLTNILKLLYQFNTCPLKIFQLVFLTFLLQSKTIVNDIPTEHVLVNCLYIIQSHLQRKIYMNIFSEHKMQIIFGLFMYSVTNEEEYMQMNEDPYKFVEIAEEYSEGAVNSGYLKIRASSLLKVFGQKLDEAIHTIIEILMVIMSGSLQSSGQDSQIMAAIKNQFSKFNFNGLNNQQKLETSFMVLTALTPHINKRKDMQKVIHAFFLTQFELLIKIESPIVILRIIRTLSYYPSALYFLYIQSQMNRGQLFMIEGLKAFQRILKSNKHDELFHFLGTILIKLLKLIKIQDPIMQLIIINLYDKMLKSNFQFYKACLQKIKESFVLNMNKNQHASIICFNLIYSLLSKQKNEQIITQIQNLFYQISNFIQSQPDPQLFNKYQDNLVNIYDTIVLKHAVLPPEVERFAKRTTQDLVSFQKGSSYFKFYNSFLIRLDGAIFKLQPYFLVFWEQFKRRCELYASNNKEYEILAPIPYYSFLMSEIIASHSSLPVSEQILQQLLQMSHILPQQSKQYPLIIFLTELYVQPSYVVNFLKKHNLYAPFLQGIIKIDFQGKTLQKIYNLAFIQLLQVQDNPVVLKQIIVQCISNLKAIYLKQRLKETKKGYEIKARKHEDAKPLGEIEQRRDNEENDNSLINLFAKFKHPFQNYSEFDQFKVKCWQNDHIINGLEDRVKEDLRVVIETEIVENSKARVIRRIKK